MLCYYVSSDRYHLSFARPHLLLTSANSRHRLVFISQLIDYAGGPPPSGPGAGPPGMPPRGPPPGMAGARPPGGPPRPGAPGMPMGAPPGGGPPRQPPPRGPPQAPPRGGIP